MNARQLKGTVTLLALVAGPALAFAAEPTLEVGDTAPKLQTGKWIQGEPVKEFQKDKAYVVEFWATWCPPCRASIPHLNETYQKYKDKGLVVIGQNCWERNENLVAPFVKQMGDKMTYRVALDDKDGSEKGKMADTWMAAAGRTGIPSAFLVDKNGLIAWIGHPMELKETTLDSVLDGTFDTQKAAAAYATEKKNEAQLQSDFQAINTAFGKEDYPAAYKLVTKVSDSYPDNPMLQNELAWQIATRPNIKQRDLKVAELCANRANEASHGKDPGILDTVARVKFMQGQKEEAIALQEKAVNLADGQMKSQFEKTLESYKRGELTKAN
jgi:thiol-disulfide isomerase/thioredoxin